MTKRMKLDDVERELSRFGKYVVKQSRSTLTRKRKNDTKDLYNSIGYKLNVSKNSFSLSFFMADYGEFQDQGVQGAFSKKKAPNSPFSFKRNRPIGAKHFQRWAKSKGLSPFAVANSVWRKGLKPSLFFTKPFEDAFLQLPEELIEQFGLDIDEFLESTQLN
tara:strand:+ start:588 stop:1073 length:486 start_codon:yes stop_codon:yes gene_type:complete